MEDQAEKLREIMRQRGEIQEKPQKTWDKNKFRIITVASGKGGVGKTNVSINMAIVYARLGKKVVVMDADLGLANVNIMLNLAPKHTLVNVMRREKTMKEILVESEYGISIVGGASGISKVADLTDEERKHFIQELNTLSYADIVIVDTSAGVSKNVLDFIAAADDAIIVTTPEPTALTDAYALTKIIHSELMGHMELDLKLVVNRARNAEEAKNVAERITGIATQFMNIKIEYLGFIYDDPIVPHAVVVQEPFTVIDPRSKAATCVQHIVERMEKMEPRRMSGGFSAMMKRIFNRA
ncbi:MAG: MinD/ParA family protein [Treponema sp.]|jgi:flagellar biosynthesis protein FlhG|nr:MinD/ParA family protein [Treponema sp.]